MTMLVRLMASSYLSYLQGRWLGLTNLELQNYKGKALNAVGTAHGAWGMAVQASGKQSTNAWQSRKQDIKLVKNNVW